MTNAYPARWIRVEKFCELTGYTVEAVRAKRKAGVWPEGIITMIRDRRLHVNVQEYDRWVERGQATSRAA